MLLLLRAEGEDGRRSHADLHGDPGIDAVRAAAPQLLHQDDIGEVVPSPASVLFREMQAQEPQLAHPLKDAVREETGLLPFVRVGRELLIDEIPDALAQQVVLLREKEVRHTLIPFPSRAKTVGWTVARFPAGLLAAKVFPTYLPFSKMSILTIPASANAPDGSFRNRRYAGET